MGSGGLDAISEEGISNNLKLWKSPTKNAMPVFERPIAHTPTVRGSAINVQLVTKVNPEMVGGRRDGNSWKSAPVMK